jgi:hypothetical protein
MQNKCQLGCDKASVFLSLLSGDTDLQTGRVTTSGSKTRKELLFEHLFVQRVNPRSGIVTVNKTEEKTNKHVCHFTVTFPIKKSVWELIGDKGCLFIVWFGFVILFVGNNKKVTRTSQKKG